MVGIPKIVPFSPFYARLPNVVVEFWEEPFTTRHGSTGIVVYVKYLDKKGKEHITEAQIKWTYQVPPPVYPPVSHTWIARNEQ